MPKINDNTQVTEQDHWASRAQYIYDIHNNSKAGRHLLDSTINRLASMGHCNQQSTILEVGCAAGTQSIAFRKKGYENAFGLDINPDVLEMAKSNAAQHNFPETMFKLGDANKMPFDDGEFDMICSIGVMEHLPDLNASLLDQKRVTKKGGWVIMAVPNAYCPWWTTIKKWRAKLSKKEHFSYPNMFRTFTPGEGVRAMEQAGLMDIKWQVADSVLPQCPDSLAWLNIVLEKLVSHIPLLKNTQAMLYVSGQK